MYIVAIVQARMGSSRLPGKATANILGKPMLWHLINRLKYSQLIDNIVIATTNKAMDKKILEKVLTGLSDKNIRFSELRNLVLSLGFDERIKGDHHIFTKAGIPEILNLQPLRDGMAKAYQVKQIRSIILKYKLRKEIKDV